MKFGDLVHERSMDYVFDLDRFARFEGKTGPYLKYTGFRLAQDFNRFYHQCHILGESDPERKLSWLKLSKLSLRQLELLTSLLGIEIPVEM